MKHQLKLLESALSSLLQCESVLQYYQSQTDAPQKNRETDNTHKGAAGSSSDSDRDEGGGEEQCNNGLVSLLLNRLLGVLKQLVHVAAAIKKG